MSLLQAYFRRWLMIFPMTGIIFFSCYAQKTYAMEPVTMALLAPVLWPYAQQGAVCVFKGCQKTIPGWINAGGEFFNIFRLPLGSTQLTLGAPFGFLGDGISNVWRGSIAPFMMTKEVLCMPLYFSEGVTEFIQSKAGGECAGKVLQALKI